MCGAVSGSSFHSRLPADHSGSDFVRGHPGVSKPHDRAVPWYMPPVRGAKVP
ncbi:MAG: hypothetical protein P4L90_11210 [Rhodopila sp.]|nr:hypothetical protein [Rhodopila sp.]